MLRLTLLATAFLLAACGRGEQSRTSVDTISVDTISVDTITVFSPSTPTASRDSRLPDSIMGPLEAYAAGHITADSAARVVVAHLRSGGRPLNVQMDAPLRDAVVRELKRRRQSQ
jgi:hypothetical protein